jgi:hypothetical protein
MKSPAAAAAKINAELQARRGIQHVDVPPIRSVSINTTSTARYVPILTPSYRLKVLLQRPPLLPPAKARASSKLISTNKMVTTSKISKSMIYEIDIL